MSLEPLTNLLEELRAKAWQSSFRPRKYGNQHDYKEHVCWRAAEKIEDLVKAPEGSIAVAEVCEIFTRLLDLTHNQRAYSWHEIQFALDEVRAKSTKDSPK